MERSGHITDLSLHSNPIQNEGAILLARSLENNMLPNLTRLDIDSCDIGDDELIALVSALEKNNSLLDLDLCQDRDENDFSERTFLALADSLPEIKVLQEVHLKWCTGLALAMPLLLEGLRKNTSLYHFYVADCGPSSVPPTTEETAKLPGGWMQEMERVRYRNCFLPLMRVSKENLPPRGI
jgi:hypothetical protein